ncbi:MAG TPA: hypothetical protein VGB30_14300 [bacterium]|jgi:hypothetical protein
MSSRSTVSFPPGITKGDSALAALMGSQAALDRMQFDPFPQPKSIRLLTNLLNKLPESMRVQVIDRITLTIGHQEKVLEDIDVVKSAQWVVRGYHAEKYPGVILGAPGLSAGFLSALTGFPFLPQPLLYNVIKRFKADDAAGYLEYGKYAAEKILANNRNVEAIVHYDPVHDRFLIKQLMFIRLKYAKLPEAYRVFIRDRLIDNAPVIILHCGYRWHRAKIGENCYWQLGGLGGVDSTEYIDQEEYLVRYREKWGGSPGTGWDIPYEYETGPESEWGTSREFIDDAVDIAESYNRTVIQEYHEHPSELSKKIFDLYRQCQQDHHAINSMYIATFTHTDTYFPIAAGVLPIWSPFITKDSVEFIDGAIGEWRKKAGMTDPAGDVYMSMHPSFCNPPDLVDIGEWEKMLGKYFKRVIFPGIARNKYPSDLGAYVNVHPALKKIGDSISLDNVPFRRPSVSELFEILTGW